MQSALRQDSLKKNMAEIILVILLGFCYLFPVFRSDIFLYSAFFDDFYYYLKIAENYCSGNGFSFTKGISTNGYQPFYQYFICALVYLSKLVGVNTLVFIRAVLALTFTGFSLLLLRQIKPQFIFSRVVFLQFEKVLLSICIFGRRRRQKRECRLSPRFAHAAT